MSEKKLQQEDCNEDNLGPGILTLTTKRIAFDKTKSRVMDFSKSMGETLLDIPLSDIVRTWREGLIMKKACISVRTSSGEKVYKFGVFNVGGWVDGIQDAINEL
ncbi:hypothetical protein [Nitrosopumilus sp. b2]|uniref:hypothetical protein n=1 Tax=Nitrosopumilus sp. b2 TaxID=2109908 RepID=UPI0015F4001F|nr:hypothetical protein [Nitrosopumilus sp. b2]KAF6245591.1 hypothetical protein C6989_00115 [Nitrosopumilus sp. b2]